MKEYIINISEDELDALFIGVGCCADYNDKKITKKLYNAVFYYSDKSIKFSKNNAAGYLMIKYNGECYG